MLLKEIDLFKDIFDAYPHQRQFFNDLFSGQYQYLMENIHRRGGKDAEFFVAAWVYANIVPGNHLYTLPKIGQARNVVWEGKDLHGVRWQDKIPRCLLAKKPQEVECKFHFTNGSILHITGADNILNAHLGSNLASTWMSEFQRTSPRVWDYLRPIIKRSKGIACFNFTSFGKGHAYQLFQKNINNPKWRCRKLTVDDTRDNNGDYIFSPEQVQEERDSGMSEDLIQQEYYCNDEVAIKGAFFAEEIELARKQGRIFKGYVVDPYLPVHTSWDIGSRDTNAIWFFQVKGTGINAKFYYFHQYDKNYGSLDHYIEYLVKIQGIYRFRGYGHHFMPHDASNVEWTSNNSRRVIMMRKGLTPTMVPKLRVIERVQIARDSFKNCYFDEEGCRIGLLALEAARSGYDEVRRVITSDEEHDWSSHPSAAFQYGHVGWLDSYNKPALEKMKSYRRVITPPTR